MEKKREKSKTEIGGEKVSRKNRTQLTESGIKDSSIYEHPASFVPDQSEPNSSLK